MSDQAPQRRRGPAHASHRRRHAELLREGIEAFNRGDQSAVAALFDDRIECLVGPGLVNTGTYHGRDGYLRMVTGWNEAWGEVETRIAAIEAPDDAHVIAAIDQRATGAASGVPVEMTVFYLLEIRDERAVRFHLYADREAALAAVHRPA